jgi:serine protease Do
MKKLLFLSATLLINLQGFAQVGRVDIKKLGRDIQKVVRKVYQASVLITPYDPSKDSALPGAFSGVVIDTAGIILSAAHAVKPDQLYQVSFADGKKRFARGLGRIVSNDAAMLKMVDKGNWAYAPMGWSSTLQKGTPCISIAYPGTVEAKTPTLRFGYVAEAESKNGFLRSTCLMEPGDSGGPLFDLKGRVIGLHSRVDLSLDDNFEIPIDTYRKYWKALSDPQSYPTLPAETTAMANAGTTDLKAMAGIAQLNNNLSRALTDQLGSACIKIKSPYKGRGIAINALGTLVKLDGLIASANLKGKSFIVSKSSMISNVVSVEIAANHEVPAEIIARDVVNDLVLLKIDQPLNGGVNLSMVSNTPIQFAELGLTLVSPIQRDKLIFSILGNTQLNIPKVPSTAYIGLSTKLSEGKVTVASLIPGGPASKAKVSLGDELLSVNGKPVHQESDLREEIESYTSNDTINLAFSRNGVREEKRVAVKMNQSGLEMHVAYRFLDGKSERYSGFNNIIIHDGRLKPAECGGPLFDASGKFYGINIARFSRTSSLSIPAAVVRDFVKGEISKAAQ